MPVALRSPAWSFPLAFAAALSATTLAGCGSHRGAHSPSSTNREWRELVSEHFALKTDLGESDALDASVKLEKSLAALSELGFASSNPPNIMLDVVYFARMDDYHVVAPKLSGGEFISTGRNDFERRPLILLGGTFDDGGREVVQHELTHLLVHQYLGVTPVWLNEGFARYLETLTFEGETAVIGRPPFESRFWRGPWQWHSTPKGPYILIPMSEAPTVEALHTMSSEAFYDQMNSDPTTSEGQRAARVIAVHYQAAWCLVHLLMENQAYRPAFDAYLERIRAGEPSNAAWEKAFSEVSVPALEADYRASLVPREVTLLKTKYKALVSPTSNIRMMDDEEADVLWARLRSWDTPESRALVESDLARARERKLDDPDRTLVEAKLDVELSHRDVAIKTLEEAAIGHPKEPRILNALGWLTLGEASPDKAQKLAPIAAKLAPIAVSAAQLDLLAHASLLNHDPDAAIAYEKKAIGVDPSCFECVLTAAQAMSQKGLDADALATATIALSLIPERMNPKGIVAILEKLRARVNAQKPH